MVFLIKKTKGWVSARGERYMAGYSIVDNYGNIFVTFKTKKDANNKLKEINKKLKGLQKK